MELYLISYILPSWRVAQLKLNSSSSSSSSSSNSGNVLETKTIEVQGANRYYIRIC